MNCSCMYIQLYAIQVKLNVRCSKTRGIGCVRGVVGLRLGLNTSSCRGPAHPSVAVSPLVLVQPHVLQLFQMKGSCTQCKYFKLWPNSASLP